MITVTQLELLNEILGTEGFIFESIFENKLINLGSKIYFLKRAISEPCHSFLQLLDNLYHNNVVEPEKSELLELIRCFKKINDLYLNTDVKNGDFGKKPCLELTFGRLGEVVHSEFKEKISQMVSQKINEYLAQNTDEIKKQYLQRKKNSKYQNGSSQWRAILELPSDQLHEQEFSSFQPRRFHHMVPLEQRMQLAQQFFPLVENGAEIRLSDFLSLDNFDLQSESHQMLSRIALLVYMGNVSLESLMSSMSGTLLMRYLNSVDDLLILLTQAEIPFHKFLSLDHHIQKQFLKYSDAVHVLVKECGLSIDQMVELQEQKLKQLLRHPKSAESGEIIQELLMSTHFQP